MRLADLPALLKEAVSEWGADNAPRLGAALAYYAIFALAPLLVLVVAVVGAVFGQQAVTGQLEEHLSYVVGRDNANYIQALVKSASEPKSGMLASVIGVVVLVFGSMGLFGELRGAINSVWKVDPRSVRGVLAGFLWDRFLSFCMLAISILLLVAALVTSLVITALAEKFGGSNLAFLSHATAQPICWIVITLAFAAVYRLLPEVTVPWRYVWLGAVVTSLLFYLGNWLIGLYLRHVSVGSVYGAAGSLAVLLVWLYYSAQVFLYGAELTKVWARRCGAEVPERRAASASEFPAATSRS
jgi:membrane protein